MKFLKCAHCGKIVAVVEDTRVPVMCCGQAMDVMVANTQDGAKEKHIPVINVEGNKVTVTVGEVAHPMTEEHSIKWIALRTDKGNQRKELKPGSEPKAVFFIGDDEKVLEAIEFCNLHGLYSKAE